jgi:Zn-dependent peptidase ImmA (M78 family)
VISKSTIQAIARRYSHLRLNLDELARIFNASIVFTDGIDSSGGIVQNPDNSWTIFINGNEPEYRIRFTIAHEIGHIVIWNLEKNNGFTSRRNSFHERLADAFAAELLMPKNEVYDALKEKLTLQEICEFFQVSKTCALLRLKELGFEVTENKCIF